jgi:hypothetical protein
MYAGINVMFGDSTSGKVLDGSYPIIEKFLTIGCVDQK